MSTMIDERVVSMEFDNSDFERNVKTSMSTLDKLKKKLKFDDTADSFNELEKSSRRVKFNGINEALDATVTKFNTWAVVGKTAIERITNAAIDAGKTLVKSLSIDQITAGWTKYADKTAAVQTMMAAITKDADGKAFASDEKKLEYINAAMDKLNTFTDETSYNFTVMAETIGKFISNGRGLEESVSAMEGIATWAAISGQNAETASRVMVQLSQAFGAGTVRLQDWMSVETANMATSKFKEQLMAVAEAEGNLVRIDGELYVNTDKINGAMKDGAKGIKTYKDGLTDVTKKTIDTSKLTKVTAEGFRSTLQENWLSTDILTKTLNEYGKFADKMTELLSFDELKGSYQSATAWMPLVEQYSDPIKRVEMDLNDLAEKSGLDIKTLTKYLDLLSSKEYELGKQAFKAAQEAKTFQEVIDATKDAASTVWMNIFESIFGDYLEAKNLWSRLAEDAYAAFVEPLYGILDLVDAWRELKGTDILFGEEASVYEDLQEIFEAIFGEDGALRTAWREVFGSKTVEEQAQSLLDFTKKIKDFTGRLAETLKNSETLKNVFKFIFSLAKTVKSILKGVWSVLSPIFKGLKDIANIMFSKGISGLSDVSERISNFFNGFTKGTTSVKDATKSLADSFASLKDLALKPFRKDLKKTTDTEPLTEFGKAFKKVSDFATTAFENIKKVVIPAWEFIKTIFSYIGKAIMLVISIGYGLFVLIDKIFSALSEVFSKIDWNDVGDRIAGTIAAIAEKFVILFDVFLDASKDAVLDFLDAFTAVLALLFSVLSMLFRVIARVANKLKELFDSIAKNEKVVEFFSGVWENIKKNFKDFGKTLNNGETTTVLEKTNEVIDKISESLKNVVEWFRSLKKPANDGKSLFQSIGDWFKNLDWKEVLNFISSLGPRLLILAGGIAAVSVAWRMGSFISNISWLVDQVRLFLKAKSVAKIARNVGFAFLSLAAAVLAITYALKQLQDVDVETLWHSVGALSALLIVIGIVLIATRKLLKKFTAQDVVKFSETFILLSAAFIIMAKAIKILDGMYLEDMMSAVLSLSTLLLVLVGVMALMKLLAKNVEKAGTFMIVATSFVFMSTSLLAIAGAIKMLADLDLGQQMSTVLALVSVLLALVVGMIAVSAASNRGQHILKVALSFLVLTGALRMLAGVIKLFNKITTDDFEKGIKRLMMTITIITAPLLLIGMLARNLEKTAASITAFALSLLVMVGVIALLRSFKFTEVLVGLGEIAGMALVMVGSIVALTRFAKMAGDAKAIRAIGFTMIEFAAAIVIMAQAIKVLAELDFWKVMGAVAAITILMGVLGTGLFILLKTMAGFKLDGKAFTKIAGAILVLSFAVGVIAAALAGLSLMNTGKVIGSAVALGIMLAAIAGGLAVVAKVVSKGDKFDRKTLLSIAGAITLISASLLILSVAIRSMTGSDLSQMAIAAAILAGVLMAIAGSLALVAKVMNTQQMSVKDMIKLALIFVLMSGVLFAIVEVAKIAQDVPWDAFGKLGASLVGLVAVLALLSLISKIASPVEMLAVSVAMAGLAAVLIILAASADKFKDASWETMGKMAAALGALAVVLAVLSFLGPQLLILAASFTVFSIGLALAALAVNLISTAFEKFENAILALIPRAEYIPLVFQKIAEGIVQALVILAQGLLANRELVFAVISMIGEGIVMMVLSFIEGILTGFEEKLPRILEIAGNTLVGLLGVVVRYTPTIVKAALDIVIGILNGFAEKMPDITQAGMNLIISFINGIATALDENAEALRDAIGNLLEGMLKFVLKMLGLDSEKADGIAATVRNLFDHLISDLVEMWGKMIGWIRDKFTALKNSVSEKAKAIKEFFTNLISNIKEKISNFVDGFKKSGKDAIQGLINGFKDKIKDSIDAIKDVGNKILGGFKSLLGIKSPSRVFKTFGGYIDEGLAEGLLQYSGQVTDATEDVGDSVINGMSGAIARASELIENNIDAEPTITPVMDLSEIQNGIAAADEMMGGMNGYGFSASANLANAAGSGIGSSGSGMSGSSNSTTNNNQSYSNTFNITGDDPEAIAREVSRILQNQVGRRDAVWAR